VPYSRPGSPSQRGEVVELGEYEWRLPVHGAVLAVARQYARVACRSWRDREACDAVLLIISELLGNAVKAAAGSCIRLRLAWTHRRVRIEVADDGDALPVARRPDVTEEGGRGLWLVGALAVRWGAFRQGRGKCVWAEVALPAG
jgi:anti-sigma regulatory factor (Ser/Thr protein kinase)